MKILKWNYSLSPIKRVKSPFVICSLKKDTLPISVVELDGSDALWSTANIFWKCAETENYIIFGGWRRHFQIGLKVPTGESYLYQYNK